MNLAAASTHNIRQDPSELFLEWFAGSGAPLSANRFKIGELSYFHFSSSFETKTGRICGAFGRSQSRKVAAIKCAAEYVERKTMLDFFSKAEGMFAPESFRTSNGWAVHFRMEEAKRRSYFEALERHLLLLSYLKFGWNGFRLVQKIESKDLSLYFLLSRYSAGGFVSGLVVAKSPLYPGVSFGYSLGKEEAHLHANFWESALFESVDRILTLNGESVDLSKDPKSWLRAEAKFFLESPFDLSLLRSNSAASIALELPSTAETRIFDVHDQFGIPTEFYAAYTWGEGLIPIFHKASLSPSCEKHLINIFKANNLSLNIPERHPIL